MTEDVYHQWCDDGDDDMMIAAGLMQVQFCKHRHVVDCFRLLIKPCDIALSVGVADAAAAAVATCVLNTTGSSASCFRP